MAVVGGVVIVGAAVIVAYSCYAAPNAAANREAVNAAASRVVGNIQADVAEKMAPLNAVLVLSSAYLQSGANLLQAKGEYVPSGLSGSLRNKYREAVHRYKDAWGLGARDDVPREVLDEMAELLREGLGVQDVVDAVDGPPDEIDELDD